MRVALTLLALWVAPVCVLAQGAGAAGAQVLQFAAGSRAAAFSGAYTAASSDTDVLFYNPAGAGTLRLGGSLSYERYVEDIALASLAGATRVGRFTLGLAALHLNAGSISERVPDPDFGGNRGLATGRSVSSSEVAARFAVATAIGERLRLGAAAGLLSTSIAEESRSAPVFDAGAQYELSRVTFGVALRNVGTALSGGDMIDADLPAEGRAGVALNFARDDGFTVNLHTDLITRLNEGDAGVIAGAEAGWQSSATRPVGGMLRAGYSAAEGEEGLAALRLGAGLALHHIAFDYTYQNLEFFGAVHRVGLRYSVPR